MKETFCLDFQLYEHYIEMELFTVLFKNFFLHLSRVLMFEPHNVTVEYDTFYEHKVPCFFSQRPTKLLYCILILVKHFLKWFTLYIKGFFFHKIKKFTKNLSGGISPSQLRMSTSEESLTCQREKKKDVFSTIQDVLCIHTHGANAVAGIKDTCKGARAK